MFLYYINNSFSLHHTLQSNKFYPRFIFGYVTLSEKNCKKQSLFAFLKETFKKIVTNISRYKVYFVFGEDLKITVTFVYCPWHESMEIRPPYTFRIRIDKLSPMPCPWYSRTLPAR